MRTRAWLLAGCMLLAAQEASADDGEAFLRIGSHWVVDPSWDLFSASDATAQVMLGGAWHPSERVGAELAWAYFAAGGEAFQSLHAHANVHQFQGAARWNLLPSSRWFRPALRGAASVVLGSVDVEGGHTIEDRAVGFGLEGTLIAELRVPISASANRWASTIALTMEAGYAWHPLALDFDAARAERDDDARPAPIRPAPIDLGALDLSGPILRFGALLRL